MTYDPTLHVENISATTAKCVCPCGQRFLVDSIAEINLVYDTGRRLLRATCPRCGRLEDPCPFWVGARCDSVDAPVNRMSQYMD